MTTLQSGVIVVDLVVVGVTSGKCGSFIAAVLVGGIGLGSRPYQLRRINSSLRHVDAQSADRNSDLQSSRRAAWHALSAGSTLGRTG